MYIFKVTFTVFIDSIHYNTGTYLQRRKRVPFQIFFKLDTKSHCLFFSVEYIVLNMCRPRIFSNGTASILSTGSPIPYIRLCGDILLVGVFATLDTIGLLQSRWLHDGCSNSGMVIKEKESKHVMPVIVEHVMARSVMLVTSRVPALSAVLLLCVPM
jgi:hypothetical protein